MAKLAIYRGETLEREVELGPRTERIGRGDQNEIVLPDPAKSVSRFHAELRYENGRYTIVDLNSQNGTWVAGKRVAQTVLEPGVPVVVGTYRLVFVGDAEPLADAEKTMIAGAPVAPRPVTPPAPPTPERAAAPAPPPAAKKEEPGPVEQPAAAPKPVAAPPPAPAPAPKPAAAPPPPPPPAPKPVAAPPPPPATPAPAPAPAAAKPAAPPPAPPKPAAPPPPKPAPAPAPAVAAKPAEPAKPTAAKPAGKKFPTLAVLAVFAVLLLGAVAAGIFLWKPAGGAAPAPSPAAQAPSPVSSQPAAAQPAVPEQQPAPAAPPAAAEKPKTEQPSIARTEPTPRAATAARAVPKEATGDPAPAAVPAKKAGRRGVAEPAPAPARPRDLGAMLAQARSAMIKGDYLAAVSNLEAIVKVDPKYQDAAQMLEMAKSGARNAAQLAVDSGAKSEMAGDYDAAIKQYEQAQQLDPGSQPAADAMRRVRGRMQADGEDAFKRAKQFDALGRSSDAIAMYEKAIKLLPSDHASTKTAKERLAALRGGD